MSSKSSCFYFQPSKAFLIFPVIFLVSLSTTVVSGGSVECYCQTPVEEKGHFRGVEFDCQGKSKITCASGGCSTVEISFTAPAELNGEMAIAKGCKVDGFRAGCKSGTHDFDDFKTTQKQCFCDGNLCNKATPSIAKSSKSAKSSKATVSWWRRFFGK